MCENMIREPAVAGAFYESNVNQSGSEIDNPNERVRVYFGNCSIDGNFNSAVNLVIVDGNVNISADYTGTIICSGQITISNNAVIKNDPDALSSVFTLQDESTGLCVANLFTSGEDFSLLEKENNAQAMGDATFNTADLITYSGWKKY
jgi:hypothetical protein